jgi:hypothetical protein
MQSITGKTHSFYIHHWTWKPTGKDVYRCSSMHSVRKLVQKMASITSTILQ